MEAKSRSRLSDHKGLLARHGIGIPKTHDLMFLVDKIEKEERDLELIKDILRGLNRYAIELRYPGESATRAEAKEVLVKIKQLRKVFLAKLAN